MVQELPRSPESFIHLDMVFTFLDRDHCMVYEPVVMQTHHFDTVHIHIEDGQVVTIREEDNLLSALGKLGMELEPLFCGGRTDRWLQEREQWHSGANFFALAPGQVIGYGRNENTMAELAGRGLRGGAGAGGHRRQGGSRPGRALRGHHRRFGTGPRRRRLPLHDHAHRPGAAGRRLISRPWPAASCFCRRPR